jgi:formylglycine-generating enzyme required for sulfatase activity
MIRFAIRHVILIAAASGASLALIAAPSLAQTPGDSLRDCETCPEMVVVPAGSFVMGSNHDEPMRGGEMRPQGPERDVTIAAPFAIGKYEVTVGEWRAFVDATGHPAADCSVWGGDRREWGHTWHDPDYGRPIADDDPIVCVYWTDAVAYAEWLSDVTGEAYRLPTEAEWEYAASGGVKTVWPWGDDPGQICEYGNILDQDAIKDPRLISGSGTQSDMAAACSDGYALVAPVGQFKPNGFALYDTVGNVWEWAQDCSLKFYPPEPVDGTAVEVDGPCEKRAVRSGSWRTRVERNRPTFRGRDPEPTAYHLFGFRVARDVD